MKPTDKNTTTTTITLKGLHHLGFVTRLGVFLLLLLNLNLLIEDGRHLTSTYGWHAMFLLLPNVIIGTVVVFLLLMLISPKYKAEYTSTTTVTEEDGEEDKDKA